MSFAPRAMYRWLDPQGAMLAEVQQGITVSASGPRAVYFASIRNRTPIARRRFACAKRVVETWIRSSGVSATVVAVG